MSMEETILNLPFLFGPARKFARNNTFFPPQKSNGGGQNEKGGFCFFFFVCATLCHLYCVVVSSFCQDSYHEWKFPPLSGHAELSKHHTLLRSCCRPHICAFPTKHTGACIQHLVS